MMPTPFMDGRVFTDGLDLSGYTNQGVLSFTAAELPASTIKDTWDRFNVGRKSVSLAVDGFWEAGARRPDESFEKVGSQVVTTVVPVAGFGAPAWSFRGVPVAYTVGAPGGDNLSFNVSARGAVGKVIRGRVLVEEENHEGIDDFQTGSEVNLGLPENVTAALHVLDIDGSLTVAIQVDDNFNFNSPTTVLTFTEATERGAQWETAIAGLGPWWRAVWTIDGEASFAVVLAAN